MRIEKLRLKGYKRLMLDNIIFDITYTPTSPYQLILGTNGSGKSSFVYELSPLPANPGFYTKDGFKEITITHKGSTYYLVSRGNRHSFIKDNVELNPGGTITVQKEFVWREFQLNVERHELLIGETKFSSMPAAVRRKWFTELSPIDYSYPLSVYDSLKTQARDTQGAIKHLAQHLATQTLNLTNLGDVEGLNERSGTLRDELNILFKSRVPNLKGLDQAQQTLQQLLAEIEDESTKLLQMDRTMVPAKHYRSLDDVEDDFNRVASEITTSDKLLEHYVKEFHELEQVLTAMRGEDGALVDLTLKVSEYEQRIAQMQATVERYTTINDPERVRGDLRAAFNSLIEVFSQLPDNTDRRFTRDTISNRRADSLKRRQDVEATERRISNLKDKIAGMLESKETRCPSCNYVWRDGFSEADYNKHVQWLRDNEAHLRKITELAEDDSRFLEEADQYIRIYQQFRSLVSAYPRLAPLWDHIAENQLQFNAPKAQIPQFYLFQRDVDRACELAAMQSDLEHVRALSEKENVGLDQGVNHLSLRLAKLNAGVGEVTQGLIGLNQDQAVIKAYRQRMRLATATVDRLDELEARLPQAMLDVLDNLRNAMIDDVVIHHHNDLATLQKQLADKDSLESIITDVTKNHGVLVQELDAYKLLLSELSPVDGLIAENMMGSIDHALAQLNLIIGMVWTYDMQVLPCHLDSGELDYKFPITNSVAPDVSKTSDGQKEIIDFSFKMMAVLYLGLQDLPLYLDEFGRNMDEQHRINAMTFIKQLIDTGYHQQVFMVSHYAASHGAFASAEVLVMDTRNIVVPSQFNQHVILA
jgi:hypothetical protein